MISPFFESEQQKNEFVHSEHFKTIESERAEEYNLREKNADWRTEK